MAGGSAEGIAAERRRLTAAVAKACEALGVECECPFHFSDEAGGTIEFAAYLADFGGPLGMVVDPIGSGNSGVARKAGLYFSALGHAFLVEDEESFLEALVDWGYFGSLAKLGETLRRKRALRRSPHARP